MNKRRFYLFFMLISLLAFSCSIGNGNNEAENSGKNESRGVAVEVPEWDSISTYDTGVQVTWMGRLYEAKWYNSGQQPDQSGEWGCWKDIGDATHFLKLTFNVADDKVSKGGKTTLTWEVLNASTITASGAWSGKIAASGSLETDSLTEYSEFTLTAENADGKSLSVTVSVLVEDIKPVILFSADSYSVPEGSTTTIEWEVHNSESVTASGAWSGSKELTGTYTTGPINALTEYTLTATSANGNTTVKTVSIAPAQTYPELALGESRILTDAQIADRYYGIDSQFLPSEVAGSIQELMSKTQYEELFPMRIGSIGWEQYYQDTHEDYYSYDNFIKAFADIAGVMVRIETKERYAVRVFRLNKATKEETYIMEHPEFNISWNQNKPVEIDVVDYGKFASEGTLETRKREFAAFLANIAHETTGGWPTAPGGQFAWGLHFKEEVYHNDDCDCGTYTSTDSEAYPPKEGECYHGRGPMQLSWNMNYGLLSQVLYADKNILLNNPDVLAHEGHLGIVAAIWFWMTPQLPKPACHNAMIGTWEPTQADINANRLPGFGTTINIINGAQEAGKPGNYRVADRIGFYEKITTMFGVDMGENVDCANQVSF